MNRRAFVTGLGAVLAAPRTIYAQTIREKRVALLGVTPVNPVNYDAFKQGVGQFGPIEGHRVVFVEQHADGTPDRLPDAMAQLLRARPDVIFARGPAPVTAAVQATKTIPIVAVDLESDPIARGFAKSLARPGGNVTGGFWIFRNSARSSCSSSEKSSRTYRESLFSETPTTMRRNLKPRSGRQRCWESGCRDSTATPSGSLTPHWRPHAARERQRF